MQRDVCVCVCDRRATLTIWSERGGRTIWCSMVLSTIFHSSLRTRLRTVFSQILANRIRLERKKRDGVKERNTTGASTDVALGFLTSCPAGPWGVSGRSLRPWLRYSCSLRFPSSASAPGSFVWHSPQWPAWNCTDMVNLKIISILAFIWEWEHAEHIFIICMSI